MVIRCIMDIKEGVRKMACLVYVGNRISVSDSLGVKNEGRSEKDEEISDVGGSGVDCGWMWDDDGDARELCSDGSGQDQC